MKTINTQFGKIYGVWVSLYDSTANKIKEIAYRIRAIQINILTKPYFVAEYCKGETTKPSASDFLNKAVTFEELLQVVDVKTKNRINKKLTSKLKIATIRYEKAKALEDRK